MAPALSRLKTLVVHLQVPRPAIRVCGLPPAVTRSISVPLAGTSCQRDYAEENFGDHGLVYAIDPAYAPGGVNGAVPPEGIIGGDTPLQVYATEEPVRW
jgi:hypothetical protein